MVVTHYPIDQEERKEVGLERIEWSEPPAYGRIWDVFDFEKSIRSFI